MGMLSEGGRKLMSKLLRGMANHTLKTTRDNWNMKDLQKKYHFKSDKYVMLYVPDVPYSVVYYFTEHGQHLIENFPREEIDCVITMSSKTVLDLLHGTSQRLKPNGQGYHEIPYDFSTAYAYNEIAVEQGAYHYSDLKYMVDFFEQEVFKELQRKLKGAVPRDVS